jgi:hypothetical protein
MIQAQIYSSEAVVGAIEIAETPQPQETEEFPRALLDFLARIRLLEGVPFDHLVPHSAILPQESIRFFYLNRNWLDAAVDGALSLGAATTADRAQLESVYTELRDAIDAAERKVWAERTGTQPQEGDAEVVTGFLMRSRAVAGWPGIHVRAFRGEGGSAELRLLRLERLAPAVLLALFDGIPTLMHVEEPRTGTQFGVDPAETGRTVNVRDPATGDPVANREVQVTFRANAPGVIDAVALRDALLAEGSDVLGTHLSPAELGLQLLQYPYRQVFGQTDDPPEDVFKPTIPMERVRLSYMG